MKTLKITCIFLLAASFFMVGCKKKPKTMDYDGVANEICACANGLPDLIKEMENLSAASVEDAAASAAKLTELQGSMNQKMKDMESCMGQLEQKYPSLAEKGNEDGIKTEAALAKKCPAVANMMKN